MPENAQSKNYNDEIDLFKVLSVLWKKKVLIIIGVSFFASLATIISMTLSQVYQVRMKVRLGYSEPQYVDGTKLLSLKGNIEAGAYNQEVVEELIAQKDVKSIPENISFKVIIPGNSDVMEVYVETAEPEFSKVAMRMLYSAIAKKDKLVMDSLKEQQDQVIRSSQIEIEKFTAMIDLKQKEITAIDKSQNSISELIQDVKKNQVFLDGSLRQISCSDEKQSLLLGNILSTYAATQNYGVINSLRLSERSESLTKQRLIIERINLTGEMKKAKESMLKAQNEKQRMKEAVLLEPPQMDPVPISPKKGVIIILATGVGFLIMILSAFVIEFISRHRKSVESL